MDKNIKRAKKDSGQDNAALPHNSSSGQQSIPPAAASEDMDIGYEDQPVPYVPLPDDPTRHPSLSWRKGTSLPASQPVDTPPSNMVKNEAIIILIGVILGACPGALLAYVTSGDVLLWALFSAALGGVVGFMLYSNSYGDTSWALTEGIFAIVPEIFNCCTFSAILVICGIAMLSGLLLAYS